MWQFVRTYGIGNFSSPDALAVCIIPTKVISCDVSLSNLILSSFILPDVLCDSKIEYAIEFLAASSLVPKKPVLEATAAKASLLSSTTSVPLMR